MPFKPKPLIPRRPKTEEQIEEETAKRANDASWLAPHRPEGKKVFNSPKKNAEDMTPRELRNAWAAPAFKIEKE